MMNEPLDINKLITEQEKRTLLEMPVIENEVITDIISTTQNTINTLPDTTSTQIAPVIGTQFGQAMEDVKINVLANAAATDKTFVEKVTSTLKSAVVKNTQVEEKRADFEKQKVDFASETLQTEQQKNEHRAIEDAWTNKEHKRQYHYNGVKPIMKFVGIEEPLNLFLLYLLTLILAPFFLLSKLLQGTIGAVVSGACDQDRPKAVKGFLWTLIAIAAVCVIAALVYLFLKWQGLIY